MKRQLQVLDNGAFWNDDIKFFIGFYRKNGSKARVSKYFTSYSRAVEELQRYTN